MDADGRDARLHGLLVERVDELLVVEPPVRLELGRKERIADRVALPAVRLQGRDRAVDDLHPSVLLRREHGVAKQPARSGELVDGMAGGGDLVVGQEIPARVVEGRAREQRHLGVAVDEDLLHVVLELVARQGVLAPQHGVPVLLGVFGEVEEPLLLEVVAHEVRLGIDDELPGQRLRAQVGDTRRGGFGAAHLEDGTEHVVHGEEGRRHAGARGQELAPAQAVLRREITRQLRHPGLDAALLRRLRQRVVFAVRDDLGRNRPSERRDFGRCGALELGVAEIVRHGSPPSSVSPGDSLCPLLVTERGPGEPAKGTRATINAVARRSQGAAHRHKLRRPGAARSPNRLTRVASSSAPAWARALTCSGSSRSARVSRIM